ncbi:zinc finger protein 354A-like [Ctenocephalides felis]|uniref:zinc finger protein 354A-like n=1 Tax=Ctenocephalides felis TaxID=7515 RepID=UPI000E6E2ECF|nr:zinc finger protein 354A-like [Ctenocephalides felis]
MSQNKCVIKPIILQNSAELADDTESDDDFEIPENIPNIHNACNKCKKTFSSAASLKRHERDVHDSQNAVKMPCDKCEKSFKTKYTLQQHLLTHDTKKSYTCTTCLKGFKLKSSLNSHLKIHKK